MFSLDVTSLFTGVPTSETIDCLCESVLGSNIGVGVPVDEARQLLRM